MNYLDFGRIDGNSLPSYGDHWLDVQSLLVAIKIQNEFGWRGADFEVFPQRTVSVSQEKLA